MKTKFISTSVLLVLSLGLLLGFKISDEMFGSKTAASYDVTKYQPMQTVVTDNVPVFTDNFDGDNTVTGLQARGYKTYNVSSVVGTSVWFQGNPTVFPAFNGPTSGYVGSNYQATGSLGNIDVWLITPRVVGGIQAGDSLTFYSRSTDVATTNYPDSIRVMYSANGDSTVAGTWTELGRFKLPNPAVGSGAAGYIRKAFRAGTAGANGRFAIRYNVVNGGTNGSNSDYIGIDALSIERTSTPPPPSSWFTQTSGVTSYLASISAPDQNTAWAVGFVSNASGPPLVVRTVNGGTWASALGTGIGAGVPLFNVYAIDANTALATGSTSSSFVYRTSNGGSTWSTVFTQAGGFINGIWMKDANTGFMTGDPVGARWSLWKTTNGGITWDSAGMNLPQVGSEAGWNNALYINGSNIWFGTNNTKVYYSSNNGANWTAQATTGQASSYGVWFNGTTGFIAGTSNVMKTTNSGTTWVANTAPGTGTCQGIFNAPGTSTWWMVRQSTGVYKTTDDGTTWTTDYTFTGTGWSISGSRTANAGGNVWVATTTGGIFKYGISTGIAPINGTTVKDFTLSQNYPNPFNPNTNIKFAIPQSGLVTLKVYNMLGKEVATLVSSNLNAGAYSYDFNAANLASGVYFYKLETANFSEVKKMMLVK